MEVKEKNRFRICLAVDLIGPVDGLVVEYKQKIQVKDLFRFWQVT